MLWCSIAVLSKYMVKNVFMDLMIEFYFAENVLFMQHLMETYLVCR
jgi:hypothetical protein